MVASLSIRSVSPQADARALYQLMDEIYASTDMMCEELTDKYPSVEHLRSDLEESANAPGALFLIAQEADSLLGYICVKPLRQAKLAHTAYLNMGVAASARGKKLGRVLLDAAMRQIEIDGIIEIVYLNVRQDNEPAVRLYESSGFETISVLERDTKFNDRYFTGLLMRRFF